MTPLPVELPVHKAGKGSLTFIFLHYWAGSGREWQLVLPQLAADYQCLAPDLRGFGAAEAPETGYTLADNAADLAALVKKHHVTNYVLVGHSMGGKIAMYFASQRPPGLRGLVLLTPSPPSAEPMTDESRLAGLRSFGSAAAAAATCAKITARPLSEKLKAQVIADNLRASRPAWDAWLARGSREDISAQLGQLQVPALLLAGDQDAVMSPSVHGLETLPHLPAGTRLEIISGAGHLLPLEAPEEIATQLRAFAAALPAPAQ